MKILYDGFYQRFCFDWEKDYQSRILNQILYRQIGLVLSNEDGLYAKMK